MHNLADAPVRFTRNGTAIPMTTPAATVAAVPTVDQDRLAAIRANLATRRPVCVSVD